MRRKVSKRYPFKVGDVVTAVGDVRASSYNNTDYRVSKGTIPAVYFVPGMVGVVASADVPPVRASSRNNNGKIGFCCVDFYVDGVQHRVALYPSEMAIVLNVPADQERTIELLRDYSIANDAYIASIEPDKPEDTALYERDRAAWRALAEIDLSVASILARV